MNLNELQHSEGARHPSYRKGRGTGSGNGKTAGKGNKGQNARSGGHTRPGFEGGQNPIFRRLPKRGFTSGSRIEYAIVNVESLNRFENETVVTPALLVESKLVRKEFNGVKILGNGKLTKKLKVSAHKFSKAAADAITSAGGTVEVL
ncbi:MAG: 50S ribosomal protein L15 [Firmicutes bacterium]|nr:50S ribosomal protein L15 [Bacillota bacterium]